MCKAYHKDGLEELLNGEDDERIKEERF